MILISLFLPTSTVCLINIPVVHKDFVVYKVDFENY